MSKPKASTVMIDADELERLRLSAARYDWLRERAVRIQGSEVWYAGGALDIRVDVGREHLAIEGERVAESKRVAKKPHRLPKPVPKLK